MALITLKIVRASDGSVEGRELQEEKLKKKQKYSNNEKKKKKKKKESNIITYREWILNSTQIGLPCPMLPFLTFLRDSPDVVKNCGFSSFPWLLALIVSSQIYRVQNALVHWKGLKNAVDFK